MQVETERLPDGSAIVITSDISARKQVEEALHEREGMLRAITENSPAIIYLRDAESRILKINKAYEKFHDITEEEAVGKIGHEWLGEDLVRQSIRGDLEVFSTGLPNTVDFEEIDFEGKVHHMRG